MQQTTEAPPDPEKTWPSVPLAYGRIQASYDAVFRRLDVVEERIRATLTLSATLTFGAPVLVTTLGGHHGDMAWFFGAIAALLANAVVGLVQPWWGKVHMPDPGTMYSATSLSPWEFQNTAVYRAAEDFAKNRALFERRARTSHVMAFLLLAEAVLLGLWAVGPLGALTFP